MKKKVFSKSMAWVLSVVMIFGMLVVSNVSLTANAYSYNASAAVDYARQYWNNYNPAYTNYNSVGGDCANFVSQCLYAGGLEQDDRWYNGSAAWINCASQIAYFRDMGFTVIDYAQANDIQIGNPVYYYNGNSMAHTAICVGYSSDGTPLVAAHNKNHWEYEWTLGGANWWGGSTRRVTILMPGHNNFPGDIDYSYAVPVSLVADHRCDTYNSAGNKEYGHYLSSGDNCYIETVYTNGFCYVEYDLDGGGTRWAYAWAGDFNIPKKANKPSATNVGVSAGTNFTPTSFWWDASENVDHYDLKIWNGTYWEGDAYKIEWDIRNTSCSVQLPAGYYEAYVDAVNSEGCTMSNNVVRFTVGDGKADIGTDFYAYIINTSAWKMATVIDDNVQLESETARRNQIWYFERQNDLTSCASKNINQKTRCLIQAKGC